MHEISSRVGPDASVTSPNIGPHFEQLRQCVRRDGTRVCWCCAAPIVLARAQAMSENVTEYATGSRATLRDFVRSRTPARDNAGPPPESEVALLVRRAIILGIPTGGLSRSQLWMSLWSGRAATRRAKDTEDQVLRSQPSSLAQAFLEGLRRRCAPLPTASLLRPSGNCAPPQSGMQFQVGECLIVWPQGFWDVAPSFSKPSEGNQFQADVERRKWRLTLWAGGQIIHFIVLRNKDTSGCGLQPASSFVPGAFVLWYLTRYGAMTGSFKTKISTGLSHH